MKYGRDRYARRPPTIDDHQTEWTKKMMKNLIVAFCLVAMTGTAALAAPACNAEIEKTTADWHALHLESGGKPSSMARGVNGHHHIQSAVDSMRIHMAAAQDLCKDGKDHESLLHLDVLRAFLQLPEIQHPTDHRYLFDAKG
jgi:hypothetical protein